MEICKLTVHELVDLLEKGEITSEEITRAYIDRIKEVDPKVKAYISVLEEDAIAKAKAKVLYICNAMTQPGETDGFGVSDHVNVLEQYLGKDAIDVVVASNTIISEAMLKKYETEEQKDPVPIDYENIKKAKYELIEDDLLTTTDGTIKHNSLKLSSVIFSYLMR